MGYMLSRNARSGGGGGGADSPPTCTVSLLLAASKSPIVLTDLLLQSYMKALYAVTVLKLTVLMVSLNQ